MEGDKAKMCAYTQGTDSCQVNFTFIEVFIDFLIKIHDNLSYLRLITSRGTAVDRW